MEVINNLREILKDTKTYLVGGSVRDLLLSRPLKDIDLITLAKPQEIGEKLLEFFGGSFFALKEELSVYRLVFQQDREAYQIDILPVLGENIEEDLRRRDFTVNALALSVEGEVPRDIIDPTGGLKDLNSKVIRMIREENIKKDPVRILRGIRLSGELGFTVEPETRKAFKQYIQYIQSVPGERVAEELRKIFSLEDAAQVVDELFKIGFFEVFNLGIKEGYELYQNYHHAETVYQHLLDALKRMEKLVVNNPLGIISNKPGYLLKMTAFFHDIGKPTTLTYDKNGRTRFFGHERESALKLFPFLEALKFSNFEKKVITILIKNHMRILSLKTAEKVSGEAVLRLIKDTGDLFLEQLLLYLADKGDKADKDLEFLGYLKSFYESYRVFQESLSGEKIIEALDIKPSPLIGELKNYILKVWARGEVSNVEEALTYLKEKRKIEKKGE